MPSPALMTGISRWLAIKWGAPAWGWRTMMTSAPTARKVYAVSSSDSPFSMLDPLERIRVVVAPSALAAASRKASAAALRSEEHTSELQSRFDLVCRLLLEKKKVISMSLGIRSIFQIHP